MTDIRKRSIRIATLSGIAGIAFLFPQVATAEDPMVNTGYFGDVAIKGYDPVAYFTENEARQGSAKYAHHWLGATWHFASAENRDLFIREPTKYAPQYGGYCADGVSLGTVTTNIDPKAWRIIEDKLYISYDPGAAEGFEKNPAKVVNSQKHWANVHKTLVSEKLQTNWWQKTAN